MHIFGQTKREFIPVATGTHVYMNGLAAAKPEPRLAEAAEGTVEVCRSFSRKLNLQNYGGNAFESVDFFASRKMQCNAEFRDEVSAELFDECVAEVRTAMAEYIANMKKRRTS